jgi:hypothetical protein
MLHRLAGPTVVKERHLMIGKTQQADVSANAEDGYIARCFGSQYGVL